MPGAAAGSSGRARLQGMSWVAADGLILGSPNWTGIRLAQTLAGYHRGSLEEGSLAGKVGAAFPPAGRHSGTEFTLLNILHWFLGNGMVVVGLPWTPLMEKAGSYYGATAIGQVTGEDLDQAGAGKAWRIALRLH